MKTEMRALWLAFALLLSSLVGYASGTLTWIGGKGPANAVIAGASGFATAITLTLLILAFVSTTPASPPHRRRR